jgi:PAS domain-containing protein
VASLRILRNHAGVTPAPPLPPDQIVTSSDLVRHFGLWQERAARAPLYVLHRGRPRFVLTSIETMEALCAQHPPERAELNADMRDATTLLDSIGDLVVMADAAGTIRVAGRAAREYFGPAVTSGGAVGTLFAAATRDMLHDALRRAVASGSSERIALSSAARPARTLDVLIVPAADGALLVARDVTELRDHAAEFARERAEGEAMRATGCVAQVRVSLRGTIIDPSPALAALTGLTRDALGRTRLVSLADPDTRAALDTAVEAAFDGGAPSRLTVGLLVHRASPVPVRIGLAPVRVGAAICGVAAVIVAL